MIVEDGCEQNFSSGARRQRDSSAETGSYLDTKASIASRIVLTLLQSPDINREDGGAHGTS